MKRLVFTGLLLGSLGLNVYLLNTGVVVKSNLDQDILEFNDEITVAQSALQKPTAKDKDHKKNIESIRKDFLPKADSPAKDSKAEAEEENEKVPADYDREYEKAREAWKEKLTRYMEDELELRQSQVDRYFELSQSRQNAVNEYLAPKIQMNPEQGYLFTIEDNVAMGKINEQYLDQLRQELGDKAYDEYIQYRIQFNKEAIKSGNADFYMEF